MQHIGSVGGVISYSLEDGSVKTYMPQDIQRDSYSWDDDYQEMFSGNRKEVGESMNDDLKDTEELLNEIYQIFIEKYEAFFQKEKIEIGYDD